MIPQGPTPIVDGFTFNSRCIHTSSYFQGVLSQLEPLRRANGYRMRMYGVPDVQNLPIGPFESVEYQIRCQPGSYLWGLNFYASQGPDAPDSEAPTNSVRIVDSCTELPLQDKPALGTIFTGTQVGGSLQQFGLGQNRGQILLPQPYLVSSPGFLNVEITNGSSFNSTCQLLMCFAEPCINEQELEQLVRRIR
jgi:hypothetical protein